MLLQTFGAKRRKRECAPEPMRGKPAAGGDQ